MSEIKRRASGQQFIEDHAEGIYVALNTCAVSADLFRRGVRKGHMAKRGTSVVRRMAIRFKLFGDAEIKEAHGAILLNENVGWLDAAMHKPRLMQRRQFFRCRTKRIGRFICREWTHRKNFRQVFIGKFHDRVEKGSVFHLKSAEVE